MLNSKLTTQIKKLLQLKRWVCEHITHNNITQQLNTYEYIKTYTYDKIKVLKILIMSSDL
jgi:hypothetical protein